jgi:hypothetical protein
MHKALSAARKKAPVREDARPDRSARSWVVPSALVWVAQSVPWTVCSGFRGTIGVTDAAASTIDTIDSTAIADFSTRLVIPGDAMTRAPE